MTPNSFGKKTRKSQRHAQQAKTLFSGPLSRTEENTVRNTTEIPEDELGGDPQNRHQNRR